MREKVKVYKWSLGVMVTVLILLLTYKKRYFLDRQLTISIQKIHKGIADLIETPESIVAFQIIFSNIKFDQPTCLKIINNKEDELLYVSEKAGRLFSISLKSKTPVKKLIIDISSQINSYMNNGLIGFEIDNAHERIYLHYNSDKEIIQVSAFEKKNAFKKESQILTVNPVYHSGGTLKLDSTGNLLISIGDSKRFDSEKSSQDLRMLQGKLLRIKPDLNNPSKYSIPNDNPYTDNQLGYKEEIYAYGFRNPYRYTLDPLTGKMYLGDVGEDNFEEINLVIKGGNYGWNIKEGNHVYRQDSSSSSIKTIPPIFEYEHGLSGFSITCGPVYRGKEIPSLQGLLLYADYVRGAIWALSTDNLTKKLIAENSGNISCFATNSKGEIYFSDLSSGYIKKLVNINLTNEDNS